MWIFKFVSESAFRMSKRHEWLIGPILVLYCMIAVAFQPSFFKIGNLLSITYAASLLLPAVLGMQALIILGHFDLSVGAVASLSGMTTGLLLVSSDNIFLSFVVGIGTGALVGMLNGSLVTRLSVSSLIATLATMGVARSIALGLKQGRVITEFPFAFAVFGQATMMRVPVIIPVALGLLFLFEWLFRAEVSCRRFYAVGSNEVAAGYCGLRPSHLITKGFIISSVGAAITGILQSSRTMSASPLVFQWLPLEAIAACVLGGSSLRGGRGTMVGAAFGLLIVTMTHNLVVLFEISVYWKDLAIGLLLLLAASFNLLRRRKV